MASLEDRIFKDAIDGLVPDSIEIPHIGRDGSPQRVRVIGWVYDSSDPSLRDMYRTAPIPTDLVERATTLYGCVDDESGQEPVVLWHAVDDAHTVVAVSPRALVERTINDLRDLDLVDEYNWADVEQYECGEEDCDD